MIARIHVNQHNIRANANPENKTKLPVITVKLLSENIYANKVEILDDNGNVIAIVVYRPNNPLPCGAKVWIETHSKIKVRGQIIGE
ncbi:MAG TPA: hypothetical protein VK184_07525 [Nostocaceae cyanobacterium]|nr:hypothetical protein [Nostocaceae cyanobacterium]